MFAMTEVGDFKAEALDGDGVDIFRVTVEFVAGADAETAVEALTGATHETFGLTPEIVAVDRGTLAQEFEKSVKAPRFADRRE
jgi:phenylacetate-CoA ligase